MSLRRYEHADDHGTIRRGPFGAWWVWLTPADHGDVPAGRARAWNVAAVIYGAAAVAMAWRLGELWWLLGVVAGLAVAAGVGVVAIERRVQRQAAERLAAYRAVPRLQRAAVKAAPERGGQAA